MIISSLEVELNVDGAPRNRVRTAAKMRQAARYLVRHPRCSLAELAAKIKSQGKKTTISSYFDRDEFWKLCAEEMQLYDHERQYVVLESYEKRFGQLDYNDECALFYIVPEMLRALDGDERTDALARSDLDEVRIEYQKMLSAESLKERLTVHH